jgi:hypothetical protein
MKAKYLVHPVIGKIRVTQRKGDGIELRSISHAEAMRKTKSKKKK